MTDSASSYNMSIAWEQITLAESIISSKPPSAREGAICSFIPEKNSIIIFGGQQGTNRNSDLYSFNLTTREWIEEKTNGVSPPSLSHAANWFDFPYLFFHGGRSNQDKSLTETYFLDVETFTWRKLFTMEQPSSRYGHVAVRNEEKQAYVFGGCNIGKKDHRFLNDLHKCEYKSIKIVEGEESNVNGASWITNVACKAGVKPPGRKGHSLALVNNCLFLFGGELKQGVSEENLYCFSIDDKEWSVVSVQGEKLPCSAYANLLQMNSGTLIVIGGKGKEEASEDIYSINVKTNECFKILQIGGGPGKRFDYMSCMTKEGSIVIFGGSNNEGLSSMDVYLLKEQKQATLFTQPSIPIEADKGTKVIQIEKRPIDAESLQSNIILQQQPYIISQLQPQSKQSKTSSPQKKSTPSSDISNRQPKPEAAQKKVSKEELNQLKAYQAQFLQEYDKNLQQTQLYKENLATIEQHFTRDLDCTFIERERAKQNKDRERGLRKVKEMKELSLIADEYIDLQIQRSIHIMALLNEYIEDIKAIDEVIEIAITKDMGYFINYDVFKENRRKYLEELVGFFKEFQVYSRYERDVNNTITKKLNEKKKKGVIEGNQSTISFREVNEGDQSDYNR